jgi:hypothetical protein
MDVHQNPHYEDMGVDLASVIAAVKYYRLVLREEVFSQYPF